MRVGMVNRLSPTRRSLSILGAVAAVTAGLGIGTAGAAPQAQTRAAKFPIAQFTCYKGTFSAFKRRQFTIENQFTKPSTAYAVAPLRVCAPAIKNRAPIPDKTSHLVCFTLRVANGPTGSVHVVASDQFGAHKLTVTLSEPESICLPAAKSRRGSPGPVPTKLDHYVCYHVQPTEFGTKTVSLQDQFNLGKTDAVYKLETLCAPTSKNKAPPVHKSVHLVCYDVKSPVKAARVAVREQFGVMKASLGVRNYLCEPALKKIVQ